MYSVVRARALGPASLGLHPSSLLTSYRTLGWLAEPLHISSPIKMELVEPLTYTAEVLNTIDILGPIILCYGGVLCTVGCLEASLTSTHMTTGAPPPPSHGNQKCLQALPNVSWGAKLSPVENHWSRQCCEDKWGDAHIRFFGESVSIGTNRLKP